MRSTVLGKVYKDGEVICRQGELGNCMYVLQEGHVEVLQRRGSSEFCLAVLDPGDYWGESALFEEEVRRATLRALGDSCVLTIEKRMFLHRLQEDPSFSIKMIRKLCRRIRELETQMVQMAGDTGEPPSPPSPQPKPASAGRD